MNMLHRGMAALALLKVFDALSHAQRNAVRTNRIGPGRRSVFSRVYMDRSTKYPVPHQGPKERARRLRQMES